jgi:type I restriction enzyme S subunit
MHGLNSGTIKDLRFVLPTLDKQKIIIGYLDGEIARIDSAISIIEQSVNKLTEYRVSIISAAATGKIDVRNS